MEQISKAETIAFALKIPRDNYTVLQIDAYNPALILSVLDHYAWPVNEEYLVNITGGTKMMSQMTFIHFARKTNVSIYFCPIGTPALQCIHPTIESIIPSHPVSIDLETYFRAHGFELQAQKKLSTSYGKAQGLFEACITLGGAANVPEISNAKLHTYIGKDKSYLSGVWFEEWLFMTLKRALQLPDSDIAFQVKLKNKDSRRKTESDNEIDVAFVYMNRLFIWECKVLSMAVVSPRKITEAVYKISSVSRALGLHATSLVCILAPLGDNIDRKAFISDISNAMRVASVIGLEDLEDEETFILNIKKMVGY